MSHVLMKVTGARFGSLGWRVQTQKRETTNPKDATPYMAYGHGSLSRNQSNGHSGSLPPGG